MRHIIVKYNVGDYISDDCGAIYVIRKVGHKYYHLDCVAGNGLSGGFDINDINDDFKPAYQVSDSEWSVHV
jgi:hypothetical protein